MRRYSASTVRAKPPTSAAAPCRSARVSSTSRVWGYGARGSACRSSPSSQTATRPRSWTGAKAAARVPTTIAAGAAGDGEEVAVARRRPAVRPQRDVVAVPERRRAARRPPGRRPCRRGRRAAHPGRRRTSPPRPGRAAPASRRPGPPTRPPAGRPRRRVPRRRRRRARGRPTPSRRRPGRASGSGRGRRTPSSRRWRAGAARRAGARRRGRRRTDGPRRALSAAISGASTGSALTTRRSGESRPSWSLAAARATT